MGFTLGKQMTAYPPRFAQDQGSAPPVLTAPGLQKVGTVMSIATGNWRGGGSSNVRFQWYTGSNSVVNATSASMSLQTAGSFLTCAMSMGNATWGTVWRNVFGSGTIVP